MNRSPTTVYMLLGFGALLASLTLLALGGVFDSSPTLPSVIRAKHDFGFVHPGEIVSHTFTIQNTWKKPLRIQKAVANCGCADLKLGKSILAPGEKTSLEIAVQTKDYPENKRIEAIVETTVGRAPLTFAFELTARGANVVELLPQSRALTFQACTMEDLPRKIVAEIRKGPHPLSWDALECRSHDPVLQPSLTQVEPGKWTLELMLSKPEAYGAFRSTLEFSFRSGDTTLAYRYRAPVEGQIRGPVEVTPSSILVGAIAPGERVVRRLQILRQPIADFPPLSIQSVAGTNDDWAKARIREESGQQFVEVVFTGAGKEGPRSGLIVITVAADRTYKVKVEYLMLVTAAKA